MGQLVPLRRGGRRVRRDVDAVSHGGGCTS
jgi:hypothetical protein